MGKAFTRLVCALALVLVARGEAVGSGIYWADGFRSIQAANSNGSGHVIVVDGQSHPEGISFDSAGRLYWTERIGGTIKRADSDGQNEITLLAVSGPRYIVVDIVNESIYWTDLAGGLGSGRVMRAELDGSNPTVLFSGLRLPWALALDVANGFVYWSDVNEAKIYRGNLDGTGKTLFVNTFESYGVALDLPGNHLYFTVNSDFGRVPEFVLRRVDLDGSNLIGLVPNSERTLGWRGILLDVATQKIYWANAGTGILPNTGSILQANLDGTDVTQLLTGLSGAEQLAFGPDIPVPPTPGEQILALIDVVESLDVVPGIARQLIAKLEGALAALQAANADLRRDAADHLHAFTNAVEAQAGKHISLADADTLLESASEILASL